MNEIMWTSPAPLWANQSSSANGSEIALGKPDILRFATDDFMQEFIGVVQNQPERLPEYLAWPETWRDPLPQPKPVQVLPPAIRRLSLLRNGTPKVETVAPSTDERPLKLFQPAHQRFYLVSACLVCRTAGLPDRAMNSKEGDQVRFVMRRLFKKDTSVSSAPAVTVTSTAGVSEIPAARWGCLPVPTSSQSVKAAPTSIFTPEGECDEYALVTTTSGPVWQQVQTGQALMDGEELLPLFPVIYPVENGRRRKLLAGMVPVGRREAYLSIPQAGQAGTTTNNAATTSSTAADQRLVSMLKAAFFQPWKNLVDNAATMCARMVYDRQAALTDSDKTNVITTQKAPGGSIETARMQFQESSWYLLLDLANFLSTYVNNFWQALNSGNPGSLTGSAQTTPYSILDTTTLPAGVWTALRAAFNLPNLNQISLRQALVNAFKYQKELDSAGQSYTGSGRGSQWPDSIFPLVDIADKDFAIQLSIAGTSLNLDTSDKSKTIAQDYNDLAAGYKSLIDFLATTLQAVLPPADATARLTPVSLAEQSVKAATDKRLNLNEPGWFVIRCVYNRPGCLPVPDALVSEPTRPFMLAGFFDPEAPARPIRIALPLDTSPAGLRKFDKNTAFMISDMLCGQVQRAKGLGLVDLVLSVLPWPFHKDLQSPDLGACPDGMICSLSIPIITICALILLMIFVTLLDIIFHWLPFFITCFPIPNFKVKEL